MRRFFLYRNVSFSGVCLMLALFCAFRLPAQPYRLSVKLTEHDERLPRYTQTHEDSTALRNEVNRVLRFFHDEGYLRARTARLHWQDSSTAIASVQLGKRFFWDSLKTRGIPPAWWRPKELLGKPFRWAEVRAWQKAVIRQAENNGFPFAEVGLDSIRLYQNRVRATLVLQKGTPVRFDTLIYPSDPKANFRERLRQADKKPLKLKKAFLMRYLDIQKGEPYNEEHVRRIRQRLQNLPYIELTDTVQVRFRNDRAYVYLPIQLPKTNRFDALVGFLPDPSEEGSFQFTGRAELELRNPFGSGKHIFLSWQRIRPETQQLNIAYEHPDLLATQFTPRIEIDWLKEDTTFFSLRRYLRLSYPFARLGTVGAVVDFRTTRLTSVQDGAPESLDSDLWSYGAHWEGNRTDRFFQPRRGWRWQLEARLGNKTLAPNPNLPDNFRDSLTNRTQQFVIEGDVSRFFRTGRLTTLLVRAQGGWIANRQLFRNDLFRIGGLQSLRGFNENFFFAARYGILTAEWRLAFDASSYVFAFADQGLLEYEAARETFTDYPGGFGTGLRFSTSAGVFTFVYAMGRAREQQLGLNTANIHFGFVSRF